MEQTCVYIQIIILATRKEDNMFKALFLFLSLTYAQVEIDQQVYNSLSKLQQYENMLIEDEFSFELLSENNYEYQKSLIIIVDPDSGSLFNNSRGVVNLVERSIAYGRDIKSKEFFVNNYAYKPFSFACYPDINMEDVKNIAEQNIKKISGLEKYNLKLDYLDEARIKVIDQNKQIIDEKQHFWRVCYRQYINNIAIGGKDGMLCMNIYPDSKIWTITSTLVKIDETSYASRTVIPAKFLLEKFTDEITRNEKGRYVKINDISLNYFIEDDKKIKLMYLISYVTEKKGERTIKKGYKVLKNATY